MRSSQGDKNPTSVVEVQLRYLNTFGANLEKYIHKPLAKNLARKLNDIDYIM